MPIRSARSPTHRWAGIGFWPVLGPICVRVDDRRALSAIFAAWIGFRPRFRPPRGQNPFFGHILEGTHDFGRGPPPQVRGFSFWGSGPNFKAGLYPHFAQIREIDPFGGVLGRFPGFWTPIFPFRPLLGGPTKGQHGDREWTMIPYLMRGRAASVFFVPSFSPVE